MRGIEKLSKDIKKMKGCEKMSSKSKAMYLGVLMNFKNKVYDNNPTALKNDLITLRNLLLQECNKEDTKMKVLYLGLKAKYC